MDNDCGVFTILHQSCCNFKNPDPSFGLIGSKPISVPDGLKRGLLNSGNSLAFDKNFKFSHLNRIHLAQLNHDSRLMIKILIILFTTPHFSNNIHDI